MRWERIGWMAALPALLAALAALGSTLAVVVYRSGDTLAARYARESIRLLDAGDNAGAILCCERLNRLDPGNSENLFNMVLALNASGNPLRAESIARGLAPADYLKHAPAVIWLARRLIVAAARSPDVAREAERLLRQIPEGHSLESESRAMLGCLLLGLGKPGEAEVELRSAVSDHPELLLILARSRELQGKDNLAREAVLDAEKLMRGRIGHRPRDVMARVHLAAATAFLGDHPRAESILQEGLKLDDSPPLHQALASLYLNWPADGQGPVDRLRLIERGLLHDPTNRALLVRLGQLTASKGDGGDRARDSLRGLLARGESLAMVHFVLGIDAADRGRKDEALGHWEQALRLSPTFAAVANNLAWELAHSDPPDLDRALKLIEVALQAQPDEPRYRDTRGHIFLKMGRWKEALTDLEAVLVSRVIPAGLHEALAQAYEGLGQAAMAAEHRRLGRGPTSKG